MTLAKTFSVSATFPAIHKIGLFQFSTASSSVIGFEVVLNADASVVSGDARPTQSRVRIPISRSQPPELNVA